MRKIKTGFKVGTEEGTKAEQILSAVLGQLSDGMWENCAAMDKYWQITSIDHDGNDIVIETGDQGKTYDIVYDTRFKNGFCLYDDAEVLCWFCTKIYQIAKEEIKDRGYPLQRGWYKIANTELEYFHNGITMKDVMGVRDSLRNLARSMVL